MKQSPNREKGKIFKQITELLVKNEYLSVRGKKFKGNLVHSIVKKKRLKDEMFKKEYPEVLSDFSLEIVDKRPINYEYLKEKCREINGKINKSKF